MPPTPAGLHEDLLWASCGGGGGTFALITEFVLKIHTLPDEGRMTSVDVRDELGGGAWQAPGNRRRTLDAACPQPALAALGARAITVGKPRACPRPLPSQIYYPPGYQGIAAGWSRFQRWLPDADWRFDFT